MCSFTLSWTPRIGPGSATEARELFAQGSALVCGTGQWHAVNPHNGPQIIRLNAPGGDWQVDATFDPDTIAVACLTGIHFPTANLTTMVAGFFGRAEVGVKNGQWNLTKVGSGGQIRSFAAHIDSRTGVNMAFAGQDSGIFSGVYDAVLPGEIQWATYPELDISGFPKMAGGHPERVASMAECNGELFATVGQKLFRRNDGHPSSWTKIWDNPTPGVSQTGLRGLTNFNGDLWACVEGTCSRIIKFTPGGDATTMLDLSGGHHFYIIGAYNNFCVTTYNGDDLLLCGVDAGADSPAHFWSLYQGTWRRIAIPQLVSHPMRSTRTIVEYQGDLYYGGYDCYSNREENTAWIVRSSLADAI